MAKYTVELGDVIKSGLKLFDFDYDFYDLNKKADFETKFINHFYFREIGCETLGRFKHYLKCKFDETLPYYNMLFRTALIDYEKTINYNVTETYTRGVDKTDHITGTSTNSGNNNNTISSNDTLTHTNDITDNGQTTSTSSNNNTRTENLQSTKENTGSEDNTSTKNDNLSETIDATKKDEYTDNETTSVHSTVTDNAKNIHSDTPTTLLSMTDLTTNVYATKVDINSNTNGTTSDNELVIERENDITDHSERSTTDEITETVNKTSHNTDTETGNNTIHNTSTTTNNDVTTETRNEHGINTNVSNGTNNNTFSNTGNATQNIVGNENETSTRNIKGSYGVITEADMLKKHIELQKTLSTITVKFFEECEDLFMQIY